MVPTPPPTSRKLPACAPLSSASGPISTTATSPTRRNISSATTTCPDFLLILARAAAGQVVGASTGQPLAAESAEFKTPFEAAGEPVSAYFYCGESVVSPAFRGHGLGKNLLRRARSPCPAPSPAFATPAFAPSKRPLPDTRRPPAHRELHGFWKRLAYKRHPTLAASPRLERNRLPHRNPPHPPLLDQGKHLNTPAGEPRNPFQPKIGSRDSGNRRRSIHTKHLRFPTTPPIWRSRLFRSRPASAVDRQRKRSFKTSAHPPRRLRSPGNPDTSYPQGLKARPKPCAAMERAFSPRFCGFLSIQGPWPWIGIEGGRWPKTVCRRRFNFVDSMMRLLEFQPRIPPQRHRCTFAQKPRSGNQSRSACPFRRRRDKENQEPAPQKGKMRGGARESPPIARSPPLRTHLQLCW